MAILLSFRVIVKPETAPPTLLARKARVAKKERIHNVAAQFGRLLSTGGEAAQDSLPI
jgi:hypothetical protein